MTLLGFGSCFIFVSLLLQYSSYTLPALCNLHAYNRIISFCHVRELKRLEVVCTRTNNSNEIRDIVATIRRGLGGTKSPTELADIIAALTHLCYMTVNLKHQADVSHCLLLATFFTLNLLSSKSHQSHQHISPSSPPVSAQAPIHASMHSMYWREPDSDTSTHIIYPSERV